MQQTAQTWSPAGIRVDLALRAWTGLEWFDRLRLLTVFNEKALMGSYPGGACLYGIRGGGIRASTTKEGVDNKFIHTGIV